MASGRPTTPPKRPKSASRGPSKGPQKPKIINFPMVFEGFLRSHMFRLSTVPDGVRGPSDRSKTAEEAPKRAQRRPWRLPRELKRAPRATQEGPKSATFQGIRP